jgi:hypothetical protein
MQALAPGVTSTCKARHQHHPYPPRCLHTCSTTGHTTVCPPVPPPSPGRHARCARALRSSPPPGGRGTAHAPTTLHPCRRSSTHARVLRCPGQHTRCLNACTRTWSVAALVREAQVVDAKRVKSDV